MIKKHYTYLDYSKDKYIGSFFCNDVMLRTDEVLELLKENEQLKKELFEVEKAYLIETTDENDEVVDLEKEIEELRKEIFK